MIYKIFAEKELEDFCQYKSTQSKDQVLWKIDDTAHY